MVPQGIAETVRTKSFKFLWRNKKDKIKRSGLYQEPDRGAIRVTDLNIIFKALKLAWIPRILASDKRNWCTIPNHFLKKMGGLNFLLHLLPFINGKEKFKLVYRRSITFWEKHFHEEMFILINCCFIYAITMLKYLQ